MPEADGAALIGRDGIHPDASGQRVIADGALAAKPFNRLTRPRDIALRSFAVGVIRVTARAPDAIVARYEIGWGASGSHAYPGQHFQPAAAGDVRGVPAGLYRVRMRAWHRYDGISPWEFASGDVTVR